MDIFTMMRSYATLKSFSWNAWSFQIYWSSQILLSYMWILAHSPSSASLKPLMGLCWVWCWIWIVYVHSTLEDNSVWPITPIIRAMQTDTSVLHSSGQFTICHLADTFSPKQFAIQKLLGIPSVLAFPNQTWCHKIKAESYFTVLTGCVIRFNHSQSEHIWC